MTLDDALTLMRVRLTRPLSCLCPGSSEGTHLDDCLWGAVAILINACQQQVDDRDQRMVVADQRDAALERLARANTEIATARRQFDGMLTRLQDAYRQLVQNTVGNKRAFAERLLAPCIRQLEALCESDASEIAH